MYKLVLLSLLLLLFLNSSDCAKILCIIPAPLYSHQIVFQPIWQELSLRNHEVTVITTNPIKNNTRKNYKQIDLSFAYELINDIHQLIYTETNLLKLMDAVFEISNNMTIEQLKHPDVQKLLKSNEKFDLLIIEAHLPAWFAMSMRFNNCPMIAVTSMEATDLYRKFMGNFNHPILNPHINLPFDNELGFFERVISVLFQLHDDFYSIRRSYLAQQEIVRKYMGIENANLYEISRNFSLLLSTNIPGFNKLATKIPTIIELVGMQNRPTNPITDSDLKRFLDGSPEGVIYFSLGSTLKSLLISEAHKQIFLSVFQDLPYKVLWKFEADVENLPGNVKIIKWAPQRDVLAHPNTKLFITQGGFQSIEEAICYKVPILALPFYGDQFYNSKRIKYVGIGLYVESQHLSKEIFKDSIQEIINNYKSYTTNLEEISALLTEQPLKALDKAIWWIEYVIKHNGTRHLKSPLLEIPFYQYYLLDVIFVIAIIFLIVAILFFRLYLFCIKVFGKQLHIKRE